MMGYLDIRCDIAEDVLKLLHKRSYVNGIDKALSIGDWR